MILYFTSSVVIAFFIKTINSFSVDNSLQRYINTRQEPIKTFIKPYSYYKI